MRTLLTTRWIKLTAALALASVSSAGVAQEDDKTKFLDDALKALEQAKRRQLLEDSSEKVDKRAELLGEVRAKAAAAVKKRDDLPRIDEDSLKSRAKVDALIKRASPQARRLIASGRSVVGGERNDAKPAKPSSPPKTTPKAIAVSPDPVIGKAAATAATAAAPTPTIGGVPVPEPDAGPDVPINRKVRAQNEKMRIVCQGTSFYDKSGNVILFEDQVVARHPGFRIECEEMEVFLESGAIDSGGKTAKKSGIRQDSSGIRRAIAKGRGKQVDLVRYTPKGELTGKCGLVIFDGRTGDIELRDWPEVSNGKFTRRATKKDSVIVIRQDGNHKTTGEYLDDFGQPDDES